jgi:hypothetical protein
MSQRFFTLIERFGVETHGPSAVHSGNMGDIIHALPAIRELGIERFVLNCVVDTQLSGRILTEGGARFLVPLLLAQPTIRCVEIVRVPVGISEGFGATAATPVIKGLPLEHVDPTLLGVDHIFDRFRLEPLERSHLVACHSFAVGATARGHARWIDLPNPSPSPKSGIILSFTPRYRQNDTRFFKEALDGLGPITKVGLPHEAWVYGDIPGDMITAADALDLADRIDRAALFVGGQSLPHAIAEGLKAPRLVDSPSVMLTSWPLGARGFVLPSTVAQARALAIDLIQTPDAPSPHAWQAPRLRPTSEEPLRFGLFGKSAGGAYSEARSHWLLADATPGLVSVSLPLAPLARDGAALATLRLDVTTDAPHLMLRALRLVDAQNRQVWALDPRTAESARFFGSLSQPDGLVCPPLVSPDGLLLVKTRPHAWFDLPVPAVALDAAGPGGLLTVDAEVMDESALEPRLFTRLATALDRYAEQAATESLRQEFQQKLDLTEQRAQSLHLEIERLKRALGPFFRPTQVLVVLLRFLKLLLTDRAGLRRAINQRGGGKQLAKKQLAKLLSRLTAPIRRRVRPYSTYARTVIDAIRTHGLRGVRGRGLRRQWQEMRRPPRPLSPRARETRWWGDDYAAWAARQDEILAHLPAEAAEAGRIISIVVPVYNPKRDEIEAMVASVLAQKYAGWELCLADDCSPDPAVRPLLEGLAAQDSRIKLIFRETNGHIAEATNSALAAASGDYVAFMDQDDMLHPAALLLCVRSFRAQPQLRLIYTDEDKLKDGVRCEPYFKPNWSPALLHAQYFINHLTVVERALVQDAGGLRKEYSGAQDMDLFLRCLDRLTPGEIGHVPLILYHWRCTPGSIAGDSSAKPYAFDAARNGLRDYFARRGLPALVGESIHFSLHRVRFPVPETTRLVLCLAGGASAVPEGALAHIQLLLAGWRARFPQGGATGLLALPMAGLEDAPDDLGIVGVAGDAQEGAALRALIQAAIRTKADVIVTASLAALPADLDTLIELAARALQEDAGLIGARVSDAENRVRHAGLIVDESEGALLPYIGMPANEHGSFGRLQLAQDIAAVAPWCLALSREAAPAVTGRQEESALATVIAAAADLRRAGRASVWTPYAAYRLAPEADDAAIYGAGLKEGEREALAAEGALTDPYYHPALSRQTLYAVSPEFPDLAILRN